MSELVSQAMSLLRTQGGRMTTQRRLILKTLDSMGGHPTADQIYEAVRCQDASINPSTIYRTLGWLAEAGLVSQRYLEQPGHQNRRKEHFEPALPAEHHHFVCRRCGAVTEFDSPRVDKVKVDFAAEYHAVVEGVSLTLYGLCGPCSRKTE